MCQLVCGADKIFSCDDDGNANNVEQNTILTLLFSCSLKPCQQW